MQEYAKTTRITCIEDEHELRLIKFDVNVADGIMYVCIRGFA